MPFATPQTYAAMLDAARDGRYAVPAINVTSSQTANAALTALANARSDGILQISRGTALYLSGAARHRPTGSLALARFVAEIADHLDVTIAMHTDHCTKSDLERWVRPLLEDAAARAAAGKRVLFHSYMWDGSDLPLESNLAIAKDLLALAQKAHALMEFEIGAIGGEEDGIQAGRDDARLYTTVDDARRAMDVLGAGENGRYLMALAFGNVHGVYRSNQVRLRPELLREIQDALAVHAGRARPFDLVFHGGSGTAANDIVAAVSHGVVKMNVDTDAQYALSRSIADYMFSHYDSVLKVDGLLGKKSAYDPRSWGKVAEEAMAARVMCVARELGSEGRSISA